MAKPGPKKPHSGQFKPGHKGGPGRPSRKREQAYLDAVSSVVSIQDWKDIAERAKDDAIGGDRHARNWLTDVLLNLPIGEQIEELRRTLAQIGDKAPGAVEAPGPGGAPVGGDGPASA